MPVLFVPAMALIGIALALFRRSTQAPADTPRQDIAARLLHWAVGLLSPRRAEWGQAMLGELGSLDGRIRRLRFALGCVGAALVLPPWERAAAGVWAASALAVGGVGVYVGVAIHFRLGSGGWITAAVLTVILIGLLVCAGALLRRPRVAGPGLLGGLFVALTALTLSGFTFLDQVLPDVVPWHPWVVAVVVPLVVGAAGTLWSRDPIVGKRIARLAAVTGGLGLYLYRNIAVAVVGTGGPVAVEGGGTLRGTINDRLGNNLVLMLFIVIATAAVGWGSAAGTGALATTRTSPAASSEARTTRAPMAAVLLLCAVVAAGLVLAAVSWLPG